MASSKVRNCSSNEGAAAFAEEDDGKRKFQASVIACFSSGAAMPDPSYVTTSPYSRIKIAQ